MTKPLGAISDLRDEIMALEELDGPGLIAKNEVLAILDRHAAGTVAAPQVPRKPRPPPSEPPPGARRVPSPPLVHAAPQAPVDPLTVPLTDQQWRALQKLAAAGKQGRAVGTRPLVGLVYGILVEKTLATKVNRRVFVTPNGEQRAKAGHYPKPSTAKAPTP